MKEKIIQSIPLQSIDYAKIYFNPGCALSIYKPESEGKVLSILQQYFPKIKMHNICCHHQPNLPKGSTIVNNCAGCDRRFRSLYEGINTITLWELLDSLSSLELPKYPEITVSVHDSCSFRQKPQVHMAVRSLLKKMEIKIIESQFSGTSSICCGDNFYRRIPIEQVNAFQKKRASQMPCKDVVVYCVSCIKSMKIGEKTPHHMVDLLLKESTEPQDLNLVSYHDALDEYIKSTMTVITRNKSN